MPALRQYLIKVVINTVLIVSHIPPLEAESPLSHAKWTNHSVPKCYITSAGVARPHWAWLKEFLWVPFYA